MCKTNHADEGQMQSMKRGEKLKLQRTRNFGPLVGSKALVSDEASAPCIRKSRWGFQEPLGGVGVSSLKFHGFIDESSSFGAEIL